MKKKFAITFILTIFLTGCVQTRYITEKYIKTKVLILESVGSYNIIDINVGKNKTIKARTAETISPSIGENVYIDFDMERVSIFNKETGDSILNKK